jgi:hypothetical protein
MTKQTNKNIKKTAKKSTKKAPAKKTKMSSEPNHEVDINQKLAYTRSAVYLEEAGSRAAISKNIEGLLLVAKGWMELADMLDTGQESKKRAKLGFRPHMEEENE